ncbi:CBS domain-containing protein [Tardiphaga sp. vice352]|uniref:CBS domain-containing protein n=1 Tax=unclassified Tardiphaga TaxID=2631404 RepID=UPI001164879E|nr:MULTISPECIES: CBS domain-containing protein [unclassified Tardiphaga]QDM15069.1 CBS domain-containing protein [Tardiphaga sp. vice278]QDM20182.1 CBS domain-containing protein [Tardiphaga sp. vice154]QDM25258.1 CBS domain-containing protein [Tardiphaga sp. vice304]QDM30466.1 CBS domain-containing protein [Tardiphaga sp. vice352]
MRAHQIMTHRIISVTPETSIADAAEIMLTNHISGLPVLNASGELVGIVSEGDFLRRSEIGTQRKRPRWLQFFTSTGRLADDFVTERGRKVEDVMTRDPVTVHEEARLEELVALMERRGVKRLPVLRNGQLVGIVTRSNMLQAVAGLAKEVPDPTADDDHIQARLLRAFDAADWRPIGLQVAVRNGVVHLYGLIGDDRARRAAVVAAENTEGVKEVHDHICLVDTWSGFYVESPEDIKAAG